MKIVDLLKEQLIGKSVVIESIFGFEDDFEDTSTVRNITGVYCDVPDCFIIKGDVDDGRFDELEVYLDDSIELI